MSFRRTFCLLPTFNTGAKKFNWCSRRVCGMTQQPTAFVRKASGLRRDVSLLDVIGLNVSNMSAGAALGIIGYTTVLLQSTAGVNLVYGSIIAWAITIPEVIVYSMMTTRISRTGGDYVWVSRVYGGFFGGALSFMGYTLKHWRISPLSPWRRL